MLAPGATRPKARHSAAPGQRRPGPRRPAGRRLVERRHGCRKAPREGWARAPARGGGAAFRRSRGTRPGGSRQRPFRPARRSAAAWTGDGSGIRSPAGNGSRAIPRSHTARASVAPMNSHNICRTCAKGRGAGLGGDLLPAVTPCVPICLRHEVPGQTTNANALPDALRGTGPAWANPAVFPDARPDHGSGRVLPASIHGGNPWMRMPMGRTGCGPAGAMARNPAHHGILRARGMGCQRNFRHPSRRGRTRSRRAVRPAGGRGASAHWPVWAFSLVQPPGRPRGRCRPAEAGASAGQCQTVRPPSTGNSTPVMNSASSEAR